MKRIAMAAAAAGVLAGVLAGNANAASVNNNPVQPRPTTPVPVITALNCVGGTGLEGCGPGWFWRDGWRGVGCYPC